MTTATKMLTLYQFEACPFCWKVKAALDYKGLDYELVEVNPLNKKELSFSPEYRKVPILVTDEHQINGSTEILEFLDKEFPERPVFDGTPEEKQWFDWANDTLVPALPPVIYATFGKALAAFGYITKVGQFSWLQKRLIRYSGALAMTIIAKKGAKKRGIKNPVLHFETQIAQWGRALGEDEFLGGERPNAADLTVYGYLKAIQTLPAFRYVSRHPRVYSWFKAVGASL